MGIKWRKSNARLSDRGIILSLSIAALSVAALLFQLGFMSNRNYESILIKNYQDSAVFEEDLLSIINQVVHITYSDTNVDSAEYYYSIKYGSGVIAYSNTEDTSEDFFKQNSAIYYILDTDGWKNALTGERIPYNGYIRQYYRGFIGLSKDFMDKSQIGWVQAREFLLPYFIIFTSLAFFGIILFVFLIVTTGRQQEKGIRLKKIDKLYTDINLVMLCSFLNFYLNKMKDLLYDDGVIGFQVRREYIQICTDFEHRPIPSSIFYIAIVAFFFFVTFVLFLSLVRQLKAGILIKHSFLYQAAKKISRIIRDIYQYLFYGDLFQQAPPTKKLYYRQLIMITSSIVFIGLTIFFAIMETALFLFPLILFVAVMYWYALGNNRIYFDIDSNIELNLDDRMKSERTKVALITNVSHDLKTPLTSIISYVDLLSKEDGLSESALDYIRILQAKSERLKNIVTDLFELAKSTSGDVTLEFEEIDLKRLVEQTLVEMDDRISASGLLIKTSLPEESANIRTDGKRLYRVFQNVIDNALKYSLQGTRIYIALTKEQGEAAVTIKNTANYEMNFTSEEILQRFVRGDQARSEEGSGLGLSIAESFTRVCGGDFKVEIDGDLFKVRMSFNLTGKP